MDPDAWWLAGELPAWLDQYAWIVDRPSDVTPPGTPPQEPMPSAGPRSRAWCFTLNNPDAELDLAVDFSKVTNVVYAVWQLERVTVPHYQGYIEMKNVATLAAMKKIVPGAHFECRKGTAVEARAYCMKDESREAGPWEYGTFTEPSSGARTDLAEVRDYILSGKSKRDVLDKYPDTLAKYPRFVDTVLIERVRGSAKPILDFTPRPWQKCILDMVTDEPHPRQILWIFDNYGNNGKTFLAKYLVQEHSGFYCNGGKSTDITYAYNGEPICIFDYVRDSEQYVNYGVIEQVKNGLYFSAKYESSMRVFAVPHVVIFANFTPDRTKMSNDRWCVINLKADGTWAELP